MKEIKIEQPAFFDVAKMVKSVKQNNGKTQASYFFSIDISDDIQIQAYDFLTGNPKDIDVAFSMATATTSSYVNKVNVFRALQRANSANNNKRPLKMGYSLLYESNNDCVGDNFKIWGVTNKSKKSKRRSNSVDERYDDPVPVKIEFDGENKTYEIPSNDLIKACNTFRYIDLISRVVYLYKYDNRANITELESDFLQKFSTRFMDGYTFSEICSGKSELCSDESVICSDESVICSDVYSDDFIKLVFGNPNFFDMDLMMRNPDKKQCGQFYLMEDLKRTFKRFRRC